MKKNIQTTLIALFALLPLGMQAQSVVTKELYEGTQILNSDFEDFHIVTDNKSDYIEPDYWHSFATASGSYAGSATQDLSVSEVVRNNSRGTKSVSIKATSIFGITANATVTTGRMNAGSLFATNKNNHAFIVVSDETDKDGFPYYSSLTERPASISVWLKFTPKSGTPKASFSAVITNGNRYQEPEDKDYSDIVVGKAKNAEIEGTSDWQHLVLPFDYKGFTEKEPKAIMVTLSTNANPGQGTAGDELLIDDLELIYTHEIKIPASGYATFTNTVMKNHKVVMPEGLKGYALAVNAGGEPYITNTFEAGDVLPYNATLLLEGKADNYTFSTTLYDDPKAVPVAGDEGLVPASELNDPLDGYKYFYLTGEGTTLAFRKADTGLKIQDDKALLRVEADKAADSYQHILFTPKLTGDINDDGQQSIADITALVNRLLGKQEQSSKLFIPSADVNDDSSTTIADVTALVNILLGKGN
jgi:hypothetical protein